MRFVSAHPVKEKTLCVIVDEMVVAEFQWTSDASKIAELDQQLVICNHAALTIEEADEIERHLLIIQQDKKSVE